MTNVCSQCGKTFEGEELAFCPYCGAKLVQAPEESAEPVDEEAMKWVRKAQAAVSYPEKKKILLKGLENCPESREIRWELLFIGEEPAKRGKIPEFAIIGCWVLEIYRNPRNFTEGRQGELRARLFDDPQLHRCLELFTDPERKQEEYLWRLCREYIEIFLEGDSRVRGSLFGFTIDRNKEKRLAAAVAGLIRRMREDEKLSPQQREQLWKSMYQAYADRGNGKTGLLDEQLAEDAG